MGVRCADRSFVESWAQAGDLLLGEPLDGTGNPSVRVQNVRRTVTTNRRRPIEGSTEKPVRSRTVRN